MKDAEDRLLESMFASDVVADNGFSARIVKRISRRLWLRRLILPVATCVGLAFAFQPLAGLVTALASLATRLPQSLIDSTAASLPHLQVIILGAILLGAAMVATRMLDE